MACCMLTQCLETRRYVDHSANCCCAMVMVSRLRIILKFPRFPGWFYDFNGVFQICPGRSFCICLSFSYVIISITCESSPGSSFVRIIRTAHQTGCSNCAPPSTTILPHCAQCGSLRRQADHRASQHAHWLEAELLLLPFVSLEMSKELFSYALKAQQLPQATPHYAAGWIGTS